MAAQPPPPSVLSAFGASGEAVRLSGGRGSAWRAGDAVLKPLDLDEAELAWQAEVLPSITCDGVRVARPRRARDGALVVAGWCAWDAEPGRHEPGRWADIIAAGESLHTALAGVPRPDFIDARTDRWAVGDRVAWNELPAAEWTQVKHLDRLAAARRPLSACSQLVHGDLTGNVLFDTGLPPAVIDFSPYWRPTAYASAIVVADALVWEGADARILDAVAHVERFGQHLLRALIYRIVSDAMLAGGEPAVAGDADPYLRAVELACRLADAE